MPFGRPGQNPAPGPTCNVVDINDQTSAVFGRSNYVHNVGSSTLWCSWPVVLKPNGVMFRNSATRLADVKDGLSNTVFAGERSSNLSDAVWPGAVPFSTHFAFAAIRECRDGGHQSAV